MASEMDAYYAASERRKQRREGLERLARDWGFVNPQFMFNYELEQLEREAEAGAAPKTMEGRMAFLARRFSGTERLEINKFVAAWVHREKTLNKLYADGKAEEAAAFSREFKVGLVSLRREGKTDAEALDRVDRLAAILGIACKDDGKLPKLVTSIPYERQTDGDN